MTDKYQLFEMTRPEVETALAAGRDTAVATFGATEQHGLHLPLGTDSLWGEALGARVAQALGDALQVPGVRIGRSEPHMDFAGSLTLGEETFSCVVSDICHSLARHGFKHIVLIPTHGGNFQPLAQATERIRPKLPGVNLIDYTDLAGFLQLLYDVAERYGFSPGHTGIHSGENETSMMLALRPDLVHMDMAEAGFVGDSAALKDKIKRHGFKVVDDDGVVGDPTGAKAEIGQAYLDALTAAIVRHVQQAK
jgi:creatinine amidohydrolase